MTSPPEEVATTSKEPAVTPPSAEGLEQFVRRYWEMRDKLDSMLQNQIIEIRGQKFRRKGFWRAIAQGFKLDLTCLKEERYDRDGDWGYIVTYRVTDRTTGRFVDGDGACAVSEKRGLMGTEHNVRSHAHTRAKNRAIADMVAFGEVSYDELTEDER
jgi:hypothetical protein